MKNPEWFAHNRWFILAAVFIFINAYGVIKWLPEDRFGSHKVAVTVHPSGDSKLNDRDAVTWVFSEPMVPERNVDRRLKHPPVTFTPPVKGSFTWVDRDCLLFEPDQPWVKSSRFRAQTDDSLRSLAGNRLTSEKPFTFETETMQLSWIRQAEHLEDGSIVFNMMFNQSLSPYVLQKYLRVIDGKKKPVEWSLGSEANGTLVRIVVGPVNSDRLFFVIEKGLFGDEGSLGLKKVIARQVEIENGLVLSGLKVNTPSYTDPFIYVHFSRGVNVNSLRHRIRVEPSVPVTVEEDKNWYEVKYILRGKFEPGKNYTLYIEPGVKSADGKVRLAKATERRLFIPDRNPDLQIRLSGHYLSPEGLMTLPLKSVNLDSFDVGVTRLYPNNLVQYTMRREGHTSNYYGSPEQNIVGHVTTRTFYVQSDKNTINQHSVSLRDVLPEDARGAYIVTLSDNKNVKGQRLIVVTDTGISVRRSEQQLLVWANSIHTLDAVSGAVVRAWSKSNQQLAEGVTDGSGLAMLRVAKEGDAPLVVTVEKGNDLSYISLKRTGVPNLSHGGSGEYLSEGYEAFLYTDRGIYRPGEKAHVRAVVRGRGLEVPGQFPVELHVWRPDGRKHRKKTIVLSDKGTAEYTIKFESYDAVGRYRMQALLPGSDTVLGETSVMMEEFVPPRLAVEARPGTNALQNGKGTDLFVNARYLYGAPAAGNRVAAGMTVTPSPFVSEQFPDYVFGDPEKEFTLADKRLGLKNCDSDGHATFSFKMESDWLPPAKLHAVLRVEVMEQGGRSVNAYASCEMHAYPFYIGLAGHLLRGMRPGDTVALPLALARTSGQPLESSREVEVTVSRISWSTVLEQDRHGKYHYKSVRKITEESCEIIKTNPDGRKQAALTPQRSGEYLVRVADIESDVSSSFKFYVGGDGDRWQSRSMEKPGRLEMKLDREEYRIGDTAELTVIAPFRGKALLTLDQSKILSQRVLEMDSNTAIFSIPVTDSFRPNVHATVSVIREVTPSGRQDIYRAVGSIPILLSSRPSTIDVNIESPEEIRPQTTLEVDLTVKDDAGQPCKAEITLAAVDEGICMLTAFQTPDPIAFFTALRNNRVGMSDLYALLMPETDEALASPASHTGGDMARRLKGRLNPVKSRRFKPVALWKGEIVTDENGKAHVSIEVPEFSGTLRLMAVAAADSKFGSAESAVLVRRPFTVLYSLPRFLAPGDVCSFPVELHNASDAVGEAVLSIDISGPARLKGQNEMRLPLEAGEQKQVLFELKADQQTGRAVIRLKAELGKEAFQDEVELAVRPATSMRSVFGTLVIPPGERKKISFPDEWMKGTDSYALQLSSRPDVKLKGSLEYLLQYPYGCLEQTVSSSFPLLYLKHIVNRPDSPLYVENASPLVEKGITLIMSMQLSSGGFGYWPHYRNPYEWGSVYAVHFMLEAQKAGYRIEDEVLESSIRYVQQLLQRDVKSPGDLQSPEWRSDAELRSYACYVLAMAGKPEHGWVTRLQEQQEYLTVDSQLYLALALAEAGRRRDAWKELSRLGGVPFTIARQDGGNLSSAAKSAALMLSAWLEMAPDSAELPALVRQLESFMNDGAWYTTQENALALMALGKYLSIKADDPADCSAVVEQNSERRVISSEEMPKYLALKDDRNALVENDGPGTLYCSWLAEGIPLKVVGNEKDAGITARRIFMDLEQKPVSVDAVRQGELLIVELTVNTLGRRLDNLVIEDLLPAGMEIENANLKTSQLVTWAKKKSNLPVRHMEVRDDRLLVFAEAFHGEKKLYYAVRAVTPGTYTRPALTVSSMYDPGIRSVHGAGKLEVIE